MDVITTFGSDLGFVKKDGFGAGLDWRAGLGVVGISGYDLNNRDVGAVATFVVTPDYQIDVVQVYSDDVIDLDRRNGFGQSVALFHDQDLGECILAGYRLGDALGRDIGDAYVIPIDSPNLAYSLSDQFPELARFLERKANFGAAVEVAYLDEDNLPDFIITAAGQSTMKSADGSVFLLLSGNPYIKELTPGEYFTGQQKGNLSAIDVSFSSSGSLQISAGFHDAKGVINRSRSPGVVEVLEVEIPECNPFSYPGATYDTIFEKSPELAMVSEQETFEEGNGETLELVLYPNPTSGSFRMRGIPVEDIDEIRLVDVMGREISLISERDRFSFEAPTGTYFVSLRTKDGTAQKGSILLINN